MDCTIDNEYLKEKLESPMPLIGMYIAAASAACAIAMAADTCNGLRTKKLWFPSKYFSLNAFSLTVLAVAMKLPVDLTSEMLRISEILARFSSLALMSTAITNFMASLGSMEGNEIMLNVAALCILVITVAVNVAIRLFEMMYLVRSDFYYGPAQILGAEIGFTFFILILLVIFCSSALMVPTAKRYIESQYKQMHKRILNEHVNHIGKFNIEELRVVVRRYWVMAESGNPQFIIAGSVTCFAACVIGLSVAIILLASTYYLIHVDTIYNFGDCNLPSYYKWSTIFILVIQIIGVVLGTIAPSIRLLTSIVFKYSNIGHKSFRDEFKVEAYWTQSLKHLRDSPLPLKHRHLKIRKILHDAKRLLLNLCIGVQILIVLTSKLVLLIFSIILLWGMFYFYIIKKLKACYNSKESGDARVDLKSETGMMDFKEYVLLPEGETELPKRTMRNICNEVDKLIQMGRKKQSKNLIEHLQKSVNFNGVREFDNIELLSLNSQAQQPNCWSLTVVTLASIAVSLPNITHEMADRLLIVVSGGLHLVKLIEKTLDSNGELTNIINAADVLWVEVELYKKWQGKDLRTAGRTHKEMLQNLSNIAEKTVTSFMTSENNYLVQDPLSWPLKVVTANSMYRITQTIMLAHDDDHPQTDDEEFERISVMISDVLAACLTNLARVIMLKCYSNVIKEREKNIRQAAVLLGESEEILETIGKHEVPKMDPEKAATIEGWRAFFMEQDHENPESIVLPTFPQTLDGHDSIELEL